MLGYTDMLLVPVLYGDVSEIVGTGQILLIHMWGYQHFGAYVQVYWWSRDNSYIYVTLIIVICDINCSVQQNNKNLLVYIF